MGGEIKRAEGESGMNSMWGGRGGGLGAKWVVCESL